MANPVLKPDLFERDASSADTMTIGGAIQKSAILIGICALTASLSWHSPIAGLLTIAGLIAGLILCLVICFKPTTAPFLAPAYAVAEGLFVGTISSYFEGSMRGIVIQTLLLTGGVFCAMLGAYQTRLIRPTKTFFAVVTGATLGILLTYVVSMILGFFGIHVAFVTGNGPYAILFSLFVCGIAALNLIIDFGVIEYGAQNRAPKYMEWYSAFGLLVTLVWLYLEILRLLARSRK